MGDRMAGIIRRMESAGIVVYLNGDTTLGFMGRNAPLFQNHLNGTITGHNGPFIVVLTGIALNSEYNRNATIRIGVGINNNYDSGCYIRTTRGLRIFLTEIIDHVERIQV
jgi:hypothetical protein